MKKLKKLNLNEIREGQNVDFDVSNELNKEDMNQLLGGVYASVACDAVCLPTEMGTGSGCQLA